jgi:N-methylhydantoinase B
MTPGSGGIVDAVDTYAEGLQFQAIKVYEEGRRNDQVWQMLRSNIRIARSRARRHGGADAASRIGAQRYLELLERYGLETGHRRLPKTCSTIPND